MAAAKPSMGHFVEYSEERLFFGLTWVTLSFSAPDYCFAWTWGDAG